MMTYRNESRKAMRGVKSEKQADKTKKENLEVSQQAS
jgi:hypothetical protein